MLRSRPYDIVSIWMLPWLCCNALDFASLADDFSAMDWSLLALCLAVY